MRTFLILALCALSTLFSGCNTSSGANNSSPKIRFVHAAPILGPVTITADSTKSLGTMSYGTANPYVEVDTGAREIKIQSVGGASTYVDLSTNFSTGVRYTYVIYGDDTTTIPLIMVDDTSNPANSANFKMRLLNLGTGLGSLDLYMISATADVNTSSPLVSGISYGAAGAFTEYTAGTFRIVLTPAGSKQIIFDSAARSFAANTLVTLMIYSTTSGKLANTALLVTDDTGTSTFLTDILSRFKFVQGAIGVPNANVRVDGPIALAGVPYAGISGYGTYSAGARNIKIEASATPGTFLYDANQNLTGGRDYSMVAYSNTGGTISLIPLPDDNLPPTAGKAKLRVVNAVSDGGAYDVYSNFLQYLTNLGAGTASGYQQIDTGTYTVAFNPAGSSIGAATVTFTITANTVNTLYLTGRAATLTANITQDY
jgi:hypothetical protein